MKRTDLIARLRKYNCVLYREGGNHSVYINKNNNKITAIPRHNEIKKFTARKICKDLDIPVP